MSTTGTVAAFRSQLIEVCAEPRTRRELFEALGGRSGIGRQRFQNLLSTALKAGIVERVDEVPNPLYGQGRNNCAVVLRYRAVLRMPEHPEVNLLDLDAVKAAGLNSAEHSARLLAEHNRSSALPCWRCK